MHCTQMVRFLSQARAAVAVVAVVITRVVGVHVTGQVDLDVSSVHVKLVRAEVAISVHGQLS